MLQLLEPVEQPIIILVRANPEPDDRLSLPYANRTIISRDAHGVDRSVDVHLFETKAGMPWVFLKQFVRFPARRLILSGSSE